MNKTQMVRLKFIDAYLMTYGSITRSVICEVFGLSVVNAGRMLTRYRALAPNNMELCFRERSAGRIWFKSADFTPVGEFWNGYGCMVPGAFMNAVGDIYRVNITTLGRKSIKEMRGA